MAYLQNVIRSIALYFVTCTLVCAETKEEKYEDLIYTTMQSIVSQNDLLTNLAVQITQMMVSVSELKVNLQETKQSVKVLEQKMLDLEEVPAMKDEITALTSSVAQTAEEVSAVKDDVDSLTTSVEQTNSKIDCVEETMGKGEVIIVSGEEAAGDENCMKVCAGTTGRDTTDWTYHSSTTVSYLVDISDCNFSRIPTVTTSVEGNSWHYVSLGTASIYNASPTSFTMYLKNNDKSLAGEIPEGYEWNVEWIAVGYTC